MKKMTTEQLTNHLIAGIAILKGIREKNEQQNQAIDAYIEQLMKDLMEEEEKKQQQGGGESPEEQKAPTKEEVQKEQEKAEREAKHAAEAKEKAEKMEEAMEAMRKLVEGRKTKIKEEKEKEEGDGVGTGVIAEDGTVKEGKEIEADIDGGEAVADGEEHGDPKETPTKIRKKPKKVTIEKPAVVVSEDKLPPSELPSDGEREIVDNSNAGKVWCAVCEEYHDDESAVKK